MRLAEGRQPLLFQGLVAQRHARLVRQLGEHGAHAFGHVLAHRLTVFDIGVQAAEVARLPAVQQVAQRQQRGGLAGLPRRVQHEVLLVADQAEHLVKVDPRQRRDLEVPIRPHRPGGVKRAHDLCCRAIRRACHPATPRLLTLRNAVQTALPAAGNLRRAAATRTASAATAAPPPSPPHGADNGPSDTRIAIALNEAPKQLILFASQEHSTVSRPGDCHQDVVTIRAWEYIAICFAIRRTWVTSRALIGLGTGALRYLKDHAGGFPGAGKHGIRGAGAARGLAACRDHPGWGNVRRTAAQVSGHGLLVHEAGFADWGMAGSLSYDPASDLGLSLALAPAWGGTATGGAHALHSRPTIAGLTADAARVDPGARITAEAAYGLPLFGAAGVGTPYLGLGLADGSR